MASLTRFPDDPVARALDEADHEYRWPDNTCVTVAARIHELACGTGKGLEIAAEWQASSYPRALVRARRLHGNLAWAYSRALKPVADYAGPDEEAEVLILCKPHRTANGVAFDPRSSGGAVLAFRTRLGETWAFGPQGLGELAWPVRPRSSWRFRRE